MTGPDARHRERMARARNGASSTTQSTATSLFRPVSRCHIGTVTLPPSEAVVDDLRLLLASDHRVPAGVARCLALAARVHSLPAGAMLTGPTGGAAMVLAGRLRSQVGTAHHRGAVLDHPSADVLPVCRGAKITM